MDDLLHAATKLQWTDETASVEEILEKYGLPQVSSEIDSLLSFFSHLKNTGSNDPIRCLILNYALLFSIK